MTPNHRDNSPPRCFVDARVSRMPRVVSAWLDEFQTAKTTCAGEWRHTLVDQEYRKAESERPRVQDVDIKGSVVCGGTAQLSAWSLYYF